MFLLGTSVNEWHILLPKNPDCVEITKEDAELISSKKSITADEHKVLNDPFINTNFQTMLRKIWCEDKSTWEVLAYARICIKSYLVMTLEYDMTNIIIRM